MSMRLKRSLLGAVALLVVLSAGLTLAQEGEQATLVVRSGERISGTLIDMGGVDFTMTVDGRERRIPINDVAVVDFSGAGNVDTSNLPVGQHHIVLKSGETVTGKLYDISGRHPLKITVTTDGGQREFSSSEVGRIVLARPAGSAAVPTTGTQATESAPAPPGAIRVSAREAWTPSGLVVRRGEAVSFSTSGEVRLSTDPNDVAGPAGARSRRYAPQSPIPTAFAGALIGRIGSGPPFAIGNQSSVPMPASGPLFLGVNDDELSDNSGEFVVTITRQSRR